MSDQPITVAEIVRKLSLSDFVDTFGNIWMPELKGVGPWQTWPKQMPMCEMMDRCKFLFLPKARQIGGSEYAAAKAVKTCIGEPGAEVIIISKSEVDAKYFIKKRVMQFLNNLPVIKDLPWGGWEPFVERVEFKNGSWIESLTSSEDAGRGRTPRLIIMDEAAAIEHARQIWKAANSGVEDNPDGQMIVISNSAHASWFNEMLKKIYMKQTRGLDLCFLNCYTHPKRDATWKARKITQYDNEVDFYTEYPETIEHMFLRREGAVYPEFDSTEGGRHVNNFEPDWANRYFYLYDHGFVHYSVFLLGLYDPYNDHLFILDELFRAEMDLKGVAQDINKKIYAWRQKGASHNPWKKIADTSIFARKGQKTVADLLRVYTNISFTKSFKYDEEGSQALVQARVRENKITIHPRCRETIRQMKDLCFDKNGKAADLENDAPDLLRYICAELNQEKRPEPKTKPKAYDHKFNKYKKQSVFADLYGISKGSQGGGNPKAWQGL